MVIRLLQARKIEGTGNEVSRDRVGSGRALYGVKRTTVVLGRMILIPSSMGSLGMLTTITTFVKDYLPVSREPSSGTALSLGKGLNYLLIWRR